METLSILKGAHSRGVCAVDFSGKYIQVVISALSLVELFCNMLFKM